MAEQSITHLGIKNTVAVYDAEAEIYEVFVDKDLDSYIGLGDTLDDCKEVARGWLAEE